MCMGVPMKIIEQGSGYAVCDNQGEKRQIDTMLVGEQPVGTWILVFIDAAREVLSQEEALKIIDALQAVKDVMNGSNDIDHLFADLIHSDKTAN